MRGCHMVHTCDLGKRRRLEAGTGAKIHDVTNKMDAANQQTEAATAMPNKCRLLVLFSNHSVKNYQIDPKKWKRGNFLKITGENFITQKSKQNQLNFVDCFVL